jgi:plastocyanin
MRRAYAIGAATIGALALVGVAIAATAETKLAGSVGPGFSITLRDAQGNAVTRVEPGEFDIEVDDKSEEHNFHLLGPGGIDVSTAVPFVGKQTFKVTLVNGRYTFQCDPHAASMRGAFDVGTGSGSTPPPPPSAPKPTAPVGAKLSLSVGPGFAISLKTLAGRKVTLLRPGAYTVVVRDRSASHNARLRGATTGRATGVGFVGTKTWRVVLRKGTLVVQCDPHKTTMRQAVKVA